jgi:hypothetical protein
MHASRLENLSSRPVDASSMYISSAANVCIRSSYALLNHDFLIRRDARWRTSTTNLRITSSHIIAHTSRARAPWARAHEVASWRSKRDSQIRRLAAMFFVLIFELAGAFSSSGFPSSIIVIVIIVAYATTTTTTTTHTHPERLNALPKHELLRASALFQLIHIRRIHRPPTNLQSPYARAFSIAHITFKIKRQRP